MLLAGSVTCSDIVDDTNVSNRLVVNGLSVTAALMKSSLTTAKRFKDHNPGCLSEEIISDVEKQMN